MTKLLVLAVLLTVTGCKELVESSPMGEPFERVRERSCFKPGYCVTCFSGVDGKPGCGFRFSPACPGTKKVKVVIQQYLDSYEDGTEEIVEHTIEENQLTGCM